MISFLWMMCVVVYLFMFIYIYWLAYYIYSPYRLPWVPFYERRQKYSILGKAAPRNFYIILLTERVHCCLGFPYMSLFRDDELKSYELCGFSPRDEGFSVIRWYSSYTLPGCRVFVSKWPFLVINIIIRFWHIRSCHRTVEIQVRYSLFDWDDLNMHCRWYFPKDQRGRVFNELSSLIINVCK